MVHEPKTLLMLNNAVQFRLKISESLEFGVFLKFVLIKCVWVPVFDAAGVDQVTSGGWWVPGRGRPLGFVVNTVCRLDPTPPPPAPLSLPALGCPPTSQTGTDDMAMKSLCFNSCTHVFCTNTFCFQAHSPWAFPSMQWAEGRKTPWMSLQSFTSPSQG